MSNRELRQKVRPAFMVALAFLCCALVLCAAILQVGHTHVNGQTVEADCALCHTAHVVVQPVVPRSLPCTVKVVAPIFAALPPVRPVHFSDFSLFTRPPPVERVFA